MTKEPIPAHFCSAPWFSARFSQYGHFTPCCTIRVKESKFKGKTTHHTLDDWYNSNYLKYIKQHMLDDVPLDECRQCWDWQNSGIVSYREDFNNMFRVQASYTNAWSSSHFYKINKNNLIFIDIKTHNHCNFECAMCDPHNSSKIYTKWINNKQNEFVTEKLKTDPTYFESIKANLKSNKSYDFLSEISVSNSLRHIKVSGGEPLLDKKLLNLLKNIPNEKKKNISLYIVTNGSQNLVDVINYIGKFKFVEFCISLEGIGVIQEYIRKHSNWEEINKNIIEYNNLVINNTDYTLRIQHVIQALSIPRVDKLIQWSYDNNFTLSGLLLYDPDYLSINVLPNLIIEQYRENLKDLKYYPNDLFNKLNESTNFIEQLQNHRYNKLLHNKFLRYIEWYDKTSKHKLIDLIPELYNDTNQ